MLTRHARVLSGAVAGLIVLAALAGCATSGRNADGPSGVTLPGISADQVKIGFTLIDSGSLQSALGFKSANSGGVDTARKQVAALVAHVNAHGGMGGRTLVPDIQIYPAYSDSPQQAQALCSRYTQDDRVFGVAMNGQLQPAAQACYTAAHTVVSDATPVAHDTKQFEDSAPYLWSPSRPEYSAFLKAQIASMDAAGFFTGSKGVQIMASDDEVARRSTSQVAEPALAALGIKGVTTSFIDSTNIGTLGSTADKAVATGRARGVDRVLVVGGARIESVVLASSSVVGWDARWSISTYDSPSFLTNNPESITASLRNGMTGLGYAPSGDVADGIGAFPDPANQAQGRCVDIVRAAGAAPPTDVRSNWGGALSMCDSVFFFKAALDRAPGSTHPSLTSVDFQKAAFGIGDTFQSALSTSSSWKDGAYTATDAGRAMVWSPAANSFAYDGPDVPLYGDAVGGTAGETSGGTSGVTPPGGETPVPMATITIPPS